MQKDATYSLVTHICGHTYINEIVERDLKLLLQYEWTFNLLGLNLQNSSANFSLKVW